MPVVLKIDLHRRIVYSAFYGKISDAEVAGHRSAIASDPDFNSAFNEIVDFSAVTEASLSEKTLAAMAATRACSATRLCTSSSLRPRSFFRSPASSRILRNPRDLTFLWCAAATRLINCCPPELHSGKSEIENRGISPPLPAPLRPLAATAQAQLHHCRRALCA